MNPNKVLVVNNLNNLRYSSNFLSKYTSISLFSFNFQNKCVLKKDKPIDLLSTNQYDVSIKESDLLCVKRAMDYLCKCVLNGFPGIVVWNITDIIVVLFILYKLSRYKCSSRLHNESLHIDVESWKSHRSKWAEYNAQSNSKKNINQFKCHSFEPFGLYIAKVTIKKTIIKYIFDTDNYSHFNLFYRFMERISLKHDNMPEEDENSIIISSQIQDLFVVFFKNIFSLDIFECKINRKNIFKCSQDPYLKNYKKLFHIPKCLAFYHLTHLNEHNEFTEMNSPDVINDNLKHYCPNFWNLINLMKRYM